MRNTNPACGVEFRLSAPREGARKSYSASATRLDAGTALRPKVPRLRRTVTDRGWNLDSFKRNGVGWTPSEGLSCVDLRGGNKGPWRGSPGESLRGAFMAGTTRRLFAAHRSVACKFAVDKSSEGPNHTTINSRLGDHLPDRCAIPPFHLRFARKIRERNGRGRRCLVSLGCIPSSWWWQAVMPAW